MEAEAIQNGPQEEVEWYTELSKTVQQVGERQRVHEPFAS